MAPLAFQASARSRRQLKNAAALLLAALGLTISVGRRIVYRRVAFR
jgi:hypothetical protein